MTQNMKFTPLVIPQIKSWVDAGLRTEQIAQKIGCTVGTLRVRCSQLGISLRRARINDVANEDKTPASLTACSYFEGQSTRGSGERSAVERQLPVFVPEITVRRLKNQAALRGLTDAALAATLLEKIAQDDLYDAVLDESDAYR